MPQEQGLRELDVYAVFLARASYELTSRRRALSLRRARDSKEASYEARWRRQKVQREYTQNQYTFASKLCLQRQTVAIHKVAYIQSTGHA